MLIEYINAAMHQAKYEILEDDKTYFGEIHGFQGIYANASSLEECREELSKVLEDWILIRIAKNLSLPSVNGLVIEIKEVA